MTARHASGHCHTNIAKWRSSGVGWADDQSIPLLQQLARSHSGHTDKVGTRCECAVTVSDEWQHKGLGTLPMKHLIEVSRMHGIRTMYSIDLADNMEMKNLVKFLGFHTRVDLDDSNQVIHELQL